MTAPSYPTDPEGKPVEAVINKASLDILSAHMLDSIAALVKGGQTPAQIAAFVQQETGNDFIAALSESAATELRSQMRAAVIFGVEL